MRWFPGRVFFWLTILAVFRNVSISASLSFGAGFIGGGFRSTGGALGSASGPGSLAVKDFGRNLRLAGRGVREMNDEATALRAQEANPL